jgi:branched-subunit amino acid transport protein
MSSLSIALVVAAVGCYGLKLAGVCLPESVLSHARVQRIAGFLPAAMLAALVTVQLFERNGSYGTDWRVLAGVAVAAVALVLKRGLLVVFVVAISVTAALRLLT